jgi:pimeloyl-ACP methyl ester carboxylesterase
LRRFALLTAAVVTLAVAAVSARFTVRQIRWLYAARVHVTAAENAQARASLPGLTDVAFQTRDGLRLVGWFVPPKNGVVMVTHHGLGGNRAAFLQEMTILARHGYGALSFDGRSSGDSQGKIATLGDLEQDDVRAAIDEALRHPGVSKIVLLGHSTGASAVAMAAIADSRVNALVLHATWTSITEEVSWKYRALGVWSEQASLLGLRLYGVRLWRIDPAAHLASYAPRPLLMIAGDVDEDTPLWMMEKVFAAAREPKELEVVHGAGHGEVARLAPVDYERWLIGFLDRSLLAH